MKQPAFQIGQMIELTIDRVRMGDTADSWMVILKDTSNPNVEFRMSLPPTWKRENVKRGLMTRCRIQQFRGRFISVCLDTSSTDQVNHPEWGYFDDYVSKQSEGAELEKKTSIVFDPNTGRPDIPRQLGFTIMKEIASFANQRGGFIYFGIHDSDQINPVRGIQGDFDYIEKWGKQTNQHYGADVDGYTRAIQDTAKEKLGSGILGLLDFDPLLTVQGLVVLRLYIKPCRGSTPVWYENEQLFVREGPRCDEKRGAVKTDFLRAWGDHLAKLPPPETDSKDALYFSILDDGSISLRERKRPDNKITHRVYVTKGVTIPGYLLLVFDNGTLVFLDPNQILKEIKENGGYSRYRIPEGLRIVTAFYHVEPVYLLALVVWQGELDGFKLFDPAGLFNEGIIPGESRRFLVHEEMEFRECLAIRQGSEWDSFEIFHPIMKRTEKGLRSFSKDLTRPDASDFGYLVQDVDSGFFSDLLQFARTGSSPKTSPRVPRGHSGYLVVSCATWETYKFTISDKLPELVSLTAEPVEPSKVESEDSEWYESPSQSWKQWHEVRKLLSSPVTALEDDSGARPTGDILFLFASGMARRMPWASVFSESHKPGATVYLRTREPLRSVHYCHQKDYLAIILNDEMKRFPAFLFVPIVGMELRNRLFVSKLQGGKTAYDQSCNILGAGILTWKTISKTASSLRDFWDAFPLGDFRCPIDGLSAQVWNQCRYSRGDALVCEIKGGNLIVNRVIPRSWRFNRSPSLQWIRKCPDLDEVKVDYEELKIPRALESTVQPEILARLQNDARRDGLRITFVEEAQPPTTPTVISFLKDALVLDERTQEVELKLVEKPPVFRIVTSKSGNSTRIEWKEVESVTDLAPKETEQDRATL